RSFCQSRRWFGSPVNQSRNALVAFCDLPVTIRETFDITRCLSESGSNWTGAQRPGHNQCGQSGIYRMTIETTPERLKGQIAACLGKPRGACPNREEEA